MEQVLASDAEEEGHPGCRNRLCKGLEARGSVPPRAQPCGSWYRARARVHPSTPRGDPDPAPPELHKSWGSSSRASSFPPVSEKKTGNLSLRLRQGRREHEFGKWRHLYGWPGSRWTTPLPALAAPVGTPPTLKHVCTCISTWMHMVCV